VRARRGAAFARPGAARVLAAVFAALVLLAGWASVRLHDPAGGLDPNWSGFAVAAVFALVLCVRAAFSIRRFERRRTSPWAVLGWCGAAVLSLLVLDAVSLASRLGG
jgi:hypothetical protein